MSIRKRATKLHAEGYLEYGPSAHRYILGRRIRKLSLAGIAVADTIGMGLGNRYAKQPEAHSQGGVKKTENLEDRGASSQTGILCATNTGAIAMADNLRRDESSGELGRSSATVDKIGIAYILILFEDMCMSGKDSAYVRLLETVEAQQGYFTTKQAIEAGYADNTHPYHLRAGNWERLWRGLYRLKHYPVAEDGEMVLWYLWSRDRNESPQGIYSHQSVLSVFELSDVMPSKLHMTVPLGFRRNSEIPKVLVLHRGLVSKSEIQQVRGFTVTRALRAILDCAREGKVATDQLALALEQGQKRGLITARELGAARQQKDNKTLLKRIQE